MHTWAFLRNANCLSIPDPQDGHRISTPSGILFVKSKDWTIGPGLKVMGLEGFQGYKFNLPGGGAEG